MTYDGSRSPPDYESHLDSASFSSSPTLAPLQSGQRVDDTLSLAEEARMQSANASSLRETPLVDPTAAVSAQSRRRHSISFGPVMVATRNSITAPSEAFSSPSMNGGQGCSQPALAKAGNQSNYVSISRERTARPRLLSLRRRNVSFAGAFALNPFLHVPASLLAPMQSREPETERRNLKIDVNGGGIYVDVSLVGVAVSSEDTSPDIRTKIDLSLSGKAMNRFPLIARISASTPTRPPLRLSAKAANGYVSVHLPVDFRGPVTIVVLAGDLDDHISLSRGFRKSTIILNETRTSRSYFVGEMGGWARAEQRWDGDEADLSVEGGMVRLQAAGDGRTDPLRKFAWDVGMIFHPHNNTHHDQMSQNRNRVPKP